MVLEDKCKQCLRWPVFLKTIAVIETNLHHICKEFHILEYGQPKLRNALCIFILLFPFQICFALHVFTQFLSFLIIIQSPSAFLIIWFVLTSNNFAPLFKESFTMEFPPSLFHQSTYLFKKGLVFCLILALQDMNFLEKFSLYFGSL